MSGDPAGVFLRALVSAGDGEVGATRLAARFGIEGWVRNRLGRLGDSPPAVHLAAQLRHQLLVEAAGQASACLAHRAVPHFVFKGVALVGRRAYQPGERDLADLDLWVHPRLCRQALEALAEAGFSEAPPDLQTGAPALRPGRVLLGRNAGASLGPPVLDLHWGVETVARVIPRAGQDLPEATWSHLDGNGPFPVPAPADHAVLLVQHLVHHDLLHVKGLLDLALLNGMGWWDGESYHRLAARFGVARAARAVVALLSSDDRQPPAAFTPNGWGGAYFQSLEGWLRWAAVAPHREHYEMTPRRLLRRLRLLDGLGDRSRVLADALWPPSEHLRWRWPNATRLTSARWLHVRNLLGKVRAG